MRKPSRPGGKNKTHDGYKCCVLYIPARAAIPIYKITLESLTFYRKSYLNLANYFGNKWSISLSEFNNNLYIIISRSPSSLRMSRLAPAGSNAISARQATRLSGRYARTRRQDPDEGVRTGAQVAPPRGALHHQVRRYHKLAPRMLGSKESRPCSTYIKLYIHINMTV